MSINWDGFLMGVSDFGQERLKEERQKKMQAQLLELKEKYEIAAEQRAEAKEKKKVVGSRDAAGQPGMVEDVNAFGEVVGTRSLDEFTRQQRERDAAKFQMEQANTQSQIDARKEELALRRTGLDIDRERNSLTRRSLDSQAAALSGTPTSPEDMVVSRLMGTLGLDKTRTEDGPLMAQYTMLAQDAARRAQVAGRNIPAHDRFNLAQRLFLQELQTLKD